jgi:membrane associated rhomboid family serine protease
MIRRPNWNDQKTPPMTLVLLVVMAILYLLSASVLDQYGGTTWQRFFNGSSVPVLAELGANAKVLTLDQNEFWRLLTATLLHGSVVHLVMNGFSLWNLGTQLEFGIGWQELLFAFLITGLSGSGMGAFFGNPLAVSIGASGAIFGLLGFLISVGTKDFQSLQRQISKNGSMVAIALFLPMLIPNVDHWAHIGGVASGLVLGFCYRNPPFAIRQLLGLSSGLLLLAGAGIIVFQALKIGF